MYHSQAQIRKGGVGAAVLC